MGNELKQKLPDYARLVTEKAFEAENAKRRKNIVTELEQAIRTSQSYGRPEDMTPRVPKMVETPVLDDTRTTQQKLADAQSAYDSYTGSQEQEQNRKKANRNAFQEAIDRVFAVPGASMSDMPLSIASPLPKDEKEQQLKAEVNYRKAQQQAEKDRAVMDKDMAEYNAWSEEDRNNLDRYITERDRAASQIFGAPQQDTYNLNPLVQKYGLGKVRQMAESIQRSRNEQALQETRAAAEKTAQERPVLGSLASVGTNLVGAYTGPVEYIKEMGQRTGRYQTLDPNNLGSMATQFGGGIRQGVSQSIQGEDGNWLRTIAAIGYEGLMSAADSGARLAAGGFNPGISAGLAASQNFGSSLQQYSAQGATPEQAAMAALASSGIEYLTEKIPMDELLKVGKGGKVWKDILKQAFLVEPTTEEISLFANVAAEAAILGEKSDRSQRIGELIAGGATYQEAKAQVNKELWNEAARTYAVSAVSGFAGAGGAAMGNRGTDVQVQQREQDAPAQTTAVKPELTQEQKTDNAIQEAVGQWMNEETEQEKQDRELWEALDEVLAPGIKGTGAAERGFSPKYALIDQYGAIPEGENPVRADQLPQSITGDDRVSYTARTALEAQATPDEFAELIENETMKGGFSYIPIRNDETVQRATETITKEGWESARANWTAAVRAGRASPDLTATGALLYNHAVNSGDYKEAMDILMDYQVSVRNSAQALQAARILKTLTPSDRLYMIRRSVDRMVEDMKLDQKIEINEDLARQYQEADTQEEADEILDEIAADVAKQIKPKTWARVSEAFTALRYLNMLGNLRTQVRNVVGNIGSRATYAVKNQIAAIMEDVVAAVNPNYQRSKVHFVNRETKKAALADYENVKDWLMGGGKYNDRSESDRFAQMVQDKRKILPSVLEQYRRATNWAMETGDQVFSKSAYANALAGYLNARGIRTDDLSTVDPKMLDQARAYAVQQAQEQTFRDNNQVSNFVGGLLRGRNTPTWARVIGEGIMPFRKTPANVLVRAEEFSPLGLINSAVNTVRAARGEISGAELVESWAKSTTGVVLFILGSALHDMGFLTGGPDPDEEKEAFETMNGYQNYALMLPDGTNLTIDFLSPMAIPLFLGAQFDQVRTAETDMGWDDYEKMLTSLGDPLIQMSMLQGVNDTLDNLRYADNTMGQFLLNAMASYLTQGLTNTLTGQIERSTEENRMTTYIDKDSDMPQWIQRQLGKASQKIPGWDYQQVEYRDTLGRTQENYGGSTGGRLLYNLLSPGYLSKAEETALTEELNRLRDATGENVYPQAPEKSFNYTDTKGNYHKDYNLSAEELETMQQVQGETAADLLNTIIRSKDYKALTDAQKASVIDAVYSYAQEQGKQEALPNYHSTAPAWMGKLGNNKAAGIIRRGALSEIDRAIDDAVNSLDNGWKVTGAAKSDIEAAAKAFDKMSKEAREEVAAGAEGETARFLELRLEGLSTDDYLDIAKAIAGLKPEAGKKEVSSTQKWEAVAKSSSLTDREKDAAIKAYMTDYNPESSSPNTTELKYDYARQELGISPEAYTMIYRAYSEVDGLSAEEIDELGRSRKQEMMRRWEAMGYDKNAALAFYNLLASTSKYQKTDVVSWYNSKGK